MFDREMLPVISVFAASLSASLLLVPLLRDLYRRAGLVDAPDGRRKHQKQPVPLAGGAGVLVAMTVALVAAAALGHLYDWTRLAESPMWSLLAAGWIIGLVGWADDVWELRGRHKLLGQFVAVGLLVATGHLEVSRVALFGCEIDLGWAGPAFAVLWMLGAINSLNLIDGMDGLLGTVGVIVCVAFAVLAGVRGDLYVACASVALGGALLGFLRYNAPPASVYLGDCGSMVVGLFIGALALDGSATATGAFPLTTPVALLILPIMDTAAAIIRRKLTGRSVYSTDRGHLHHCLLRSGLDRRRTLLLVAALGTLAAAGALAAALLEQDGFAVLAAGTVVTLLVKKRLFGHAELTLIKERAAGVVAAIRHSGVMNHSHRLEVRLQGSADWNSIWAGVTDAAEELNLRSVYLDVNAPALHEGYHARWERFDDAPENLHLWRTDLPLFAGGQVIGRLSVSGVCSDGSTWSTLVRLAKLVTDAEYDAHRVAAVPGRPQLYSELGICAEPVGAA